MLFELVLSLLALEFKTYLAHHELQDVKFGHYLSSLLTFSACQLYKVPQMLFRLLLNRFFGLIGLDKLRKV